MQTAHFTKSMARVALFAVAIAGVALVSGCAKHFRPPASARLVGGGESIHFEAPSNGTLFLVDDRELLQSQTMKKGEVFEAKGAVAQTPHGNRTLTYKSRIYFEPEDSSQIIEIDQWTDRPKDR